MRDPTDYSPRGLNLVYWIQDVSKDERYRGNCQICGPVPGGHDRKTAAAIRYSDPARPLSGGGSLWLCDAHFQQALAFLLDFKNARQWATQLP